MSNLEIQSATTIHRFGWEYDLSDSCAAINTYCSANNSPDWCMVGVLSRDEIEHIRATAREI